MRDGETAIRWVRAISTHAAWRFTFQVDQFELTPAGAQQRIFLVTV
jgi:hypothetical protein